MNKVKSSPQLLDNALNICTDLFSKKCCKLVLRDFSLSDPACNQLIMTKLVGYGIVVGASLVKLPQVLKLFVSKSGVGLAVYGVLLELLAITFNACYSFRNDFPFSAWGEAIFLALETCLIAFLAMWYEGQKSKSLLFVSSYVVLVSCLAHPDFIPKDILWWLQTTVLPLSVTGKLTQAFKNYKSQHTGQLSAVTAWAILAGSITRVFTTIQETGDQLTAVTFACAACANAVIALQVLYYWKSTQKFLEKGKKKKKK